MRVCGCLKIFLKSQFLGYCVILSPMYSMVCRKDTDVKQTISYRSYFFSNEQKKNCSDSYKSKKLKIFPKVGVPYR